MDMIISIVRNTDTPRVSDDDINNCEIHVLGPTIPQPDLAEYFATYGSRIDHLFDCSEMI